MGKKRIKKAWSSLKKASKRGVKKVKEMYDNSDIWDTVKEKSKSSWRSAKIKAKNSRKELAAFKRNLKAMINDWVDKFNLKLEARRERQRSKKIKNLQNKKFRKDERHRIANSAENMLEARQKANRKKSMEAFSNLEKNTFGYRRKRLRRKRLLSKKLRSKKLRSKRVRRLKMKRLRSKRLRRKKLRSKRLLSKRLRSKRLLSKRLRSKRLLSKRIKMEKLKIERLDKLRSQKLRSQGVKPQKVKKRNSQSRADKTERMSK
jgi:hypothetical protein